MTPHRILIVRPSALGDVCRSVPLLSSLRLAYPDAAIDWLVQDSFADAVRSHPALTEVVPFPRRELGNAMRNLRFRDVIRWLSELRSRHYDLVIDAQGLFRSGLITRSTGAAVRVGYRDARELGWLGLTNRIDVSAHTHTVDRMLELLRGIGLRAVVDLRLVAPPDESGGHDRFDGVTAVIAPTSRWTGKRWPADRFAAAATSLLESGAIDRAILVGSASERSQCEPLLKLSRTDLRVVDRIGATSVGALMRTIRDSSLVIANDSAAIHMAVGFDRPMVALYGPTRIDRVGPYGRARDVIQHVAPGDNLDHKNESRGTMLMNRINVDEVIAASIERLSRSSSQTPA